MKETPIIFGIWAIPKILDGSKTQTRRVMKPQPPVNYHSPRFITDTFWGFQKPSQGDIPHLIKCPYGQVGGKLWVRESHKLTKIDRDGEVWIQAEYRFPYENDEGIRYFKWADIPIPQRNRLRKIRTWGKWRPARFMYKFLARIWLEITGVRAERLQEIGFSDCQADVIPIILSPGDNIYGNAEMSRRVFRAFQELWDSLNAKKSYGWETNPWVWAIEFLLRIKEGICRS